MALTVKQKSKPTKSEAKDLLKPEQADALTQEERDAVDRLAELEKQMVEFKPIIAEYEEKKKLLASVASDKTRFDPKKPAVLRGFKAVATFSEVGKARFIKDMHNLIGKMKAAMGGYEKLIEEIKIPLGVVDKYLSTAECEGIIEEKDGSRRFKDVHEQE